MFSLLTARVLVRVEGSIVFLIAAGLFGRSDGRWLLFILLLFAPDLSMVGYVSGPKVGAAIYNIVHTYLLPVLLGIYGWMAAQPLALSLALIWTAHIGLDRLLGFGLKYSTGFKDTHLQRL